MKARMLILTGIVSCLAFTQSPGIHTDYRDAYVGTYLCTCICQRMDLNQNKLAKQSDTTILFISKDTLDSILKIDVNQNTYLVKLKNGIMDAYPPGRHWGGKLSVNNVSFGVSTNMTTVCKYKGKKKPS